MNKKQDTIDTYNEYAEIFIIDFNARTDRVSIEIETAFSLLKSSNPVVLELGCGNGRDASLMLKYTSTYIGIDLSEELLKEAKRSLPNLDFRLKDFETFDFLSNLDLIFANASLLHTDRGHLKDILIKGYNSLNKSGIFYMVLKKGFYHEEIKDKIDDKRTFYFYNPEEVKELAKGYLNVVYNKEFILNGKEWFSIALQK